MSIDTIRKVNSFSGPIVSPPSPSIAADPVSAASSPSIQGKLSQVFRDSAFKSYLKQVSDSASQLVTEDIFPSNTSNGTGSIYSELSPDENVPEESIPEEIEEKQHEPVEHDIEEVKPRKSNIGAIGLSLLPNQCELLAHKKGEKFNLMVAGNAGTGKRTFINTLFGTRLMDQTKNISTNSIAIHKFKLLEKGFQLNLTTIDTPGYGRNIDNQFTWMPICDFIDEQFRLYLFQNEQPNRTKVTDNRVHCCLYFIEPTGTNLNCLDIVSMQNISQRVNLIPVIAKSDILSKQELDKFRTLVKNELQIHDIKICDLILDENVRDKITKSVPFSIIGSNDVYNGKRGRKYPWGVVEVENLDHCDFKLLRDILLCENMLDLVSSTEACFDKYRLNCLEKRFKQVNKNDIDVEELDGFEQFKIYYQMSLKEFEQEEKVNETIFQLKQQKVKDKLADYVSSQEVRFKEWKQALVEKQAELNEDIGKEHKRMLKLQSEIDELVSAPTSKASSDSSNANESAIK